MKFYEDPIYIEMCRKAQEMQGTHKPERGDWYFTGYGKVQVLPERDRLTQEYISDIPGLAYSVSATCDYLCGSVCPYHWIPRLDQLFEMLDADDIYTAAGSFKAYMQLIPKDRIPGEYNLTLEIHALECVMSRRFGKVWHHRSKEWVKV